MSDYRDLYLTMILIHFLLQRPQQIKTGAGEVSSCILHPGGSPWSQNISKLKDGWQKGSADWGSGGLENI
jgi:hypothetical protein